jgi:hypothetical protein
MLAFALRRIYRIPTGLIYVHRGLSDESGVLRELSLPMIRVSESSSLRDDDGFPRVAVYQRYGFLGVNSECRGWTSMDAYLSQRSSQIRPLRLFRCTPEARRRKWRRGANAATLRAEKSTRAA